MLFRNITNLADKKLQSGRMSNEQLILELKKRKIWLLLFVLGCFFISFYIQQLYFNSYSGTVHFTMTSGSIMDVSIYEPAKPEKIYIEQKDISKVFSIIYSNEVLDALIKKYNLYQHYQIDTLNTYHYEILIQILIENIDLKVINENLVSLSFRNNNNILAADIANEIVEQVNFYYKKQYKNLLKDKIRLYETIMNDVAEKDSLLRNDIYRVINDIKPFAMALPENHEDPHSLRKKIDYLIDQLYFNKENFLGTYKLYRSALKATDELDIRILTVLRRALPETEKKISQKMLISSAVSFFGLFVYVLLLYIYLINRPLIKLFFSKN